MSGTSSSTSSGSTSGIASTVWEHTFHELFQLLRDSEAAQTLHQWVDYQGFTSIFDLLSLRTDDIKFARTSNISLIIFNITDSGEVQSLTNHQVLLLTALLRFIHHVLETTSHDTSSIEYDPFDLEPLSDLI